MNVLNVNCFLSHKTHGAALIFVSLVVSETPVYTAIPWIGIFVSLAVSMELLRRT